MGPLQKRVGSRVAYRRRLSKLTQPELAERVDVATETISRLERGTTLPSLASLDLIAAALGCELSDLFQAEKAPRAERSAIDRLLACVANRPPDDIHLVADIATRMFQRFGNGPRRSGRNRSR